MKHWEVIERFSGGPGRGWWGPPRGTHTKIGSQTLAEQVVRAPSSELVRRIDDEIARRAKLHRVSIEEFEDTANKNIETFLEESEVSIRIPSRVLGDIVEDGKFKNQYEVGESGGQYNPKLRQACEAQAFDVGIGEEPSAYPVYGYMSHPKAGGADSYGAIEVILKPSIKDRTTFTVGDSLGALEYKEIGPTPVNKPGKLSWDAFCSDVFLNSFEMEYVEAQIHGGVSLADISRVVIHGTKSRYSGAESTLKSAGIPVKYGDLDE